MPQLSVFNSISIDGFFSGENDDISWAHDAKPNAEFDKFVAENAKGGGVLLFGRKTYDMMASYWPTDQARRDAPEVAQGMNNLSKIVFLRTMRKAAWQNTTVVTSDPAAEVRKLKNGSGPNLVVLGSGSIVALLTRERLIDEFQFVVVPVVLGRGRTMFEGVTDRVKLDQLSSRTFNNGNIFARYKPSW